MSFSDPLVLHNVAEANVTFARKYADKAGSLYYDAAAVPPEANEIQIRHQATGSGLSKGDRHTWTYNMVRTNTAGELVRGAVNLSLNVPSNGVISEADISDGLRALIDFLASTTPVTLSTTTISALLRGEM